MTLDIARLYSQGRAKSPSQLWSTEENDAVYTLVRECGLSRPTAADYVRNGILTKQDFDKAEKKDFKPEKLDDVVKHAEDGLKENGPKVLKGKKK